jgi:RHS repeat-associated protein
MTDLNNTGSNPHFAALGSFLPTNDPLPAGKPMAYLNWMLLDEQLKYVSSYPQSGAIPVGAAGTLNALAYTGIPITKSGYLYIWVSNETPSWNVFFDNLSLTHYTGPELEETHYYPFGLTMAGISSKALKPYYPENKYLYNSKELQNNEFSDGTGLDDYDYGARMLDPQIGRWKNLDPIADNVHGITPYNYAFDNPVQFIDKDGLIPGEVFQTHTYYSHGNVRYEYTVTTPIAGFLQGALGISRQIIQNTRWSEGGFATGGIFAITLGNNVDFNTKLHDNNDVSFWTTLVGHESTHRDEIEAEGDINFI